MSENEYKSKKSRSTFVARGEKDRAYLVVTGEAATKVKVMKEVERIRIGGGSFWEVDATARQLAATY
ncbi:MAG: hypothetical protein IKP90_05070 [Fibrobacter sp.]|nr:hypothetical protein [Fibrobacter sp.]